MSTLGFQDDNGKFQGIYVNGITDGNEVLTIAKFKQVQEELIKLKKEIGDVKDQIKDGLIKDVPEIIPPSLPTIPSNQPSPMFYIDLDKYGIKQGTFGKPPYTKQQWEIAYNNLLGFNKALEDADKLGLSHVVVPRGKYSFCYTNLKGASEIYMAVNTSIKMFPNQTLDMNGSTFEVMYDSVNKNPYDKSPATTPAWKLSGDLISIFNAPNAHVKNGVIIGDIPNRSFSDGGSGFNSERGMEQTYGIKIDAGSHGATVENLNVSMFMGDGIVIGAYGAVKNRNIITGDQSKSKPGYMDENGVIVKTPGAYISDKYPLIQGEHKEIQMRSGGGYTRIVPIKNNTFEYIFFNGETIISRKKAIYLQTVTVPHNTTHLRIQFTNEKEGLAALNNNFAITKPQIHNVKIEDCVIHNNHRGGISGGADFTTVRNCKIYHNGEDSSIGVPIFPDSTRYQINFEDSYSNKLIIENNLFFSGFHGVLAGVHHLHASGNLFYNVNGIIVYNNANSVITGNEFYESVPLQLMGSNETQNRNILFENNTAYSSLFPINATDLTLVKVKNNTLYLDGLNLAGNVEFTDNTVKSYSSKYYTNYSNIRIDNIKKCTDNTFEDFNYGSHYRLSVMKPRHSNSTIKNNVFRSCSFNSHNLANHIEFIDSEFYDCNITGQILDATKSSSITFDNCLVQDCVIGLGGKYINNTKDGNLSVEVLFYDCDINFTEAYTSKQLVSIEENVAKSSYPKEVKPRAYELNIEKSKVNFYNSKLSPIYLIKYNPATDLDIDIVKKINIEDSRLQVSDINKFKLFRSDLASVSSNSASLVRNKYIGFNEFPSPKYGSLV